MSNDVTPSEIRKLMDRDYVNNHKIECVRILRKISFESLKETTDFFKQDWLPFVNERNYNSKSEAQEFGQEPYISGLQKALDANNENLPPPMFLIGYCYKQFNGETVLIAGASNQNKHHETVYSINSDGNVVHRYNRRDFGRVTGSDSTTPSPLNLIIPE